MSRRKAQENTVKIENALKQIKASDASPDVYDPTVYTDDAGLQFRTTDRIIDSVPPPTNHKPSDAEVFGNNGLPDYEFLMDHFRREGKLSQDQVIRIMRMATSIFSREPNLLRVPPPVTVCGDIHGQFYDLLKLFEVAGSPKNTSFLFMGDYVDRGSSSLETLLLLYSMKINHPDTFFMLRGNHETRQMTTHFTFKSECLVKYTMVVYEVALESFASLPIVALMNKQFMCLHGGLARDLETLDQINEIDRFKPDVPSKGLFCDLMWSDPSDDYDDESVDEPLFKPNYERGCSFMFSYEAVCQFLKNNGLLCIIRAHQAQDAGYRMYRKTSTQQFPSVITLFSAPNYCGTYGNKAAVLKYDTSVMNIRQFSAQPEPYHLPDFMNVFTWSIPFVAERTLDIMFSVLNICTEDELQTNTVLSKELAQSVDDVAQGRVESVEDAVDAFSRNAAAERKAEEYNLDEKTTALRRKILAIGRVSRMFNILREEAEKVEQLRSLSGGQLLPKGVLLGGSDELNKKISSFEEARLADLKNEAMPPSDAQQQEEQDELYQELVRRASVHES